MPNFYPRTKFYPGQNFTQDKKYRDRSLKFIPPRGSPDSSYTKCIAIPRSEDFLHTLDSGQYYDISYILHCRY